MEMEDVWEENDGKWQSQKIEIEGVWEAAIKMVGRDRKTGARGGKTVWRENSMVRQSDVAEREKEKKVEI